MALKTTAIGNFTYIPERTVRKQECFAKGILTTMRASQILSPECDVPYDPDDEAKKREYKPGNRCDNRFAHECQGWKNEKTAQEK